VLGEDSFLAREGVVSALEAIDEVELVGACGDLDELREAIERASPDVVLTDIRMPPTSTDEGVRLATELRSTHPDVGVVLLSQHAEPLYATALFEQGSARRAYMLKERVKSRSAPSSATSTRSSGSDLGESEDVSRRVKAVLLYLNGSLVASGGEVP